MFMTLENIFDLSKYENKLERQSAVSVYITLAVMLVLVSAYLFLIPDVGAQNELTRFQDALTGSSISLFTIVFFYVAVAFVYISVRRGQLIIGGVGISILWFVLSIGPVLFGSRNVIQPDTTLALCILIILSGLVLHERGLIAGTIVALFTVLIFFDSTLITTLPIVVSQLAGASIFVYMYIRYAKVSYEAGAESATAERIKMADMTVQISNLTLNYTDMTDMLKQGLELVQNCYPQFYHVQVFLLDESGRNAQLVSSTGEIGRALIQSQHSIGVGSPSVIGQAMLNNTHVIARTTDVDSVHQHNELLPDTVLEMAFPLHVGNQVIGALDLQSKSNINLQDTDLFTYQSLANSFALVIDHMRQSEVIEAHRRENQVLTQQVREARQESERLNKQVTEQAWSEYLDSQNEQVGRNIDFTTNVIEENQSWSTLLSQAVADGNVIQSQDNDQKFIAVPLKVRGHVIGAMEFELGEDGSFDPDDINFIQEVSERFALAAENTRLVEQSQRNARREAFH